MIFHLLNMYIRSTNIWVSYIRFTCFVSLTSFKNSDADFVKRNYTLIINFLQDVSTENLRSSSVLTWQEKATRFFNGYTFVRARVTNTTSTSACFVSSNSVIPQV